LTNVLFSTIALSGLLTYSPASIPGLTPWAISCRPFGAPDTHAIGEYVRDNPVRAGLVERVGEWPYQGEIVLIDL